MRLDELIAMFPPPEEIYYAGSDEQWQRLERESNLIFPEDYKMYTSLYGSGSFEDFLHIYNPFTDNLPTNLVHLIPIIYDVYEHGYEGRNESAWPFKGFLQERPIMPFARTNNGDELFWHCKSDDPNQWGITINETRSTNWEFYDLCFVDFLVQVYKKEITPDIFEDLLPGENPRYDNSFYQDVD